MSVLLIHDVPIECINQAAVSYLVPAKVIIAVLATEGGRTGSIHKNKDGTEDYGPMQINSSWLSKLSQFNYSRDDLINNPCLNVIVGAWILSQKISEGKNYWQGVAGYNSFTPKVNANYQYQVVSNYNLINEVLK